MATYQLVVNKFESKGQKTPEYTALCCVSEKMRQDIDGEKHAVMQALHAAQVIPPTAWDTANILSEVARNPVLFYALYRVLEEKNVGDRYQRVLMELDRVFFGK